MAQSPARLMKFVTGLLVAGSVTLVAQQIYPPRVNPTGPPTFPAEDADGLVLTPGTTNGVHEIRHAWKRKVFWKVDTESVLMRNARIPVMTAPERQEMTRVLDALIAVLKATPTGSQGEGFWVNEARRLDYFDTTDVPAAALAKHPLEFSSGLYPFYHEDILQKDGTWRRSVKGETEGVYFEFNRLPGSLQQPVVATESTADGTHELYLKPRATQRYRDFPVYEGELLIVARAGRELWNPVATGRALKAMMPLYEKDRVTAEQRLANLKKENDVVQSDAWEKEKRDTFEKNNGALRTTRPSNFAARSASLENEIRVLRQNAAAAANPQRDGKGSWYWNPIDAHKRATEQLAALTADGAAAPSCYVSLADKQQADGSRATDGRYAARGDLVAAGTAGCREVVDANHAYFDASLPRSTPQLLVVRSFGRCARVVDGEIVLDPVRRFTAPPQGCYQHQRMWAEADWTKIGALVKP